MVSLYPKNEHVDLTIEAVDATLWVYKRALDEGVDKYSGRTAGEAGFSFLLLIINSPYSVRRAAPSRKLGSNANLW